MAANFCLEIGGRRRTKDIGKTWTQSSHLMGKGKGKMKTTDKRRGELWLI